MVAKYSFGCCTLSELFEIHKILQIYAIKCNSSCLCECFNFFKTTRHTNIKLGMINHLPLVSVIRDVVT